jgi:hypothetical protein
MEPVLFLLFALLVLLEALPVARPAAAAVLRGGAGAFAVFTLAADEFDFGASGVVDPAAAAASAPFDVDRLGVAAGDDRECDTLECEFVVADEPFSVGAVSKRKTITIDVINYVMRIELKNRSEENTNFVRSRYSTIG